MTSAKQMNSVWLEALRKVRSGNAVSPRGKPTREILQHTLMIDMRRPILTIPERKLNYQFMAAEAFWILSGDNTVAGIAPYNKNISQFSDDGVIFAGAYGPKIHDQIQYVVNKLCEDLNTRQAGLTIWRQNPGPSKDIPCTVAIFFSVRQNKLNTHVFMRSNDIWLGTPYDVFNFSMLGHYVCSWVNAKRIRGGVNAIPNENGGVISPGVLYHTAASLHLYEENNAQCDSLISSVDKRLSAGICEISSQQNETPESYFNPQIGTRNLIDSLKELRETKVGDSQRWWEKIL